MLVFLPACAPGKSGDESLAFIRNFGLWRIQSDGSVLFQIAGKYVTGFAWSPDHHQLVARFAANTSIPVSADPLVGDIPDTQSVLGIVSIDSGNILSITPASNGYTSHSDAWWDANGNRLIYREGSLTQPTWYLSQADQPSGIARKAISTTIAIPTASADGSQIAAIDDIGNLVVGSPSGGRRSLLANLPATLPSGWPMRLLWQPHHQAILFAASPDPDTTMLKLVHLDGTMQNIGTYPAMRQYIWSPDGERVLIQNSSGFVVHTLSGGEDLTWAADADALPWWSPDGKWLMVRSARNLVLVNVIKRTVQPLATFDGESPEILSPDRLSHPVTGNPWSGDSRRFALIASGGMWINNAQLKTHADTHSQATGLYIIDTHNLQRPPQLIDWGEHTSISWSTPDASSQFLIA
jgi:hypothetical protein